MKIRPVGAELFHADERRTDGGTDGLDETDSCLSQFCERSLERAIVR